MNRPSLMLAVMPLLFAACHRDPARRPPAETPAVIASTPAPGADLDGPVPLPARSERRRPAGKAEPIDLGTDRPPVAVTLPVPPEGGAAPFTFDGDRAGWVARIPGGERLPAVAYGDGRIYVSAGFESYSFYALDARDGHILWASQALEDNGPTAPSFDDGRVLFNTESCTLFVMDARTGKKLWHKYLGDPTLSQPAVASGLVFAAHPGEAGSQPALSAYRVENGDEVWTRTVGGELLAAPVVYGDSVYVSTIAGRSFRFLRAGGRPVWSRVLHATTAPWIAGEELFFSRREGDREVQAVASAATGRLLRKATSTVAGYLEDVPSTLDDWKKVWAFEGSRPVVVGGVRYVAMGGEVEASDPVSGERLWRRRDSASRGARSLGTVALAGPEVVVSTRRGELYGLDVDTGYTLWAYRLGHPVAAEPVIARGWVYTATTDGRVVAMQVGDRALDGWHMFGGNPQHDGPVPHVANAL